MRQRARGRMTYPLQRKVESQSAPLLHERSQPLRAVYEKQDGNEQREIQKDNLRYYISLIVVNSEGNVQCEQEKQENHQRCLRTRRQTELTAPEPRNNHQTSKYPAHMKSTDDTERILGATVL